MNRSAGILLPLFSLPGPYGIGTLGAEARAFVDFLHQAGQTWWQILPVGPAGPGNSPYDSPSTFAGNPLLVDAEPLAQAGLLTAAELEALRVPPSGRICYQGLAEKKEALLRRAFRRGEEREKARAFLETCPWLQEYALFMAAKGRFHGTAWTAWPDEAIRSHRAEACRRYREELAEEVEFHAYVQLLFARQWAELKAYANARGVSIIGDLPMYVSLDSADVWSERGQFLLDGAGRPRKVAGVPPDAFSAQGQLWGNPLYDWGAQRADGFGWWIRRVAGAAERFDAIRLDHFRGFAAYWAVPAGADSAEAGAWEQGPGMDLLGVLTTWFPQLTYIAEDLGLLTPEVHQLRQAAGLPGMRVLEFAFSGPGNVYLPHHYPRRCVCYTGTHDNDTAVGWYTHAPPEERAFAEAYLGYRGSEAVCRGLLRLGQGSVAELFIAQMQDYLALGSEARINVPGTREGNWQWRLLPGQAGAELAGRIGELTARYGR